MSSMEGVKRKRVDGRKPNGWDGKPLEADGGLKKVAPLPPPDEEVEKFFAIVKRIQVARKYFERRDGGEPVAKPTWSPSFLREDFEGVQTVNPEGARLHRETGLDLNSDPGTDGSDSV